MTVIYLLLIVIGITFSASGAESDTHPYCFQFTWLGLKTPDNCSEQAHTPCVKPFVITPDDSPPNVTYMWENINRTAISCPLSPGYTCLKYSYTLNNAVLNISYFCGKMIEDKSIGISDGCYSGKVNGHTVEVCACRSGGGMMPCNSSLRTHNSISALIILIFISVFVSGRLSGTEFSIDIYVN